VREGHHPITLPETGIAQGFGEDPSIDNYKQEKCGQRAGAGYHPGMCIPYGLLGILSNRPPWFCSEGLVNMRHNSSSSNGRLNELVEFLVSPDGQLQVTWCYTFDPEITGGIAGQFEDFGGEVFQNRCHINRRFRSHSHVVLRPLLQISMETTDRELKASSGAPRLETFPLIRKHGRYRRRKFSLGFGNHPT